jgi:hypothetical protein
VLQARLELAGLERVEAEVVVEVLAQLEVGQLRARHEQEHGLERHVALAEGAAHGEGAVGIVGGQDDRAGPAVLRLRAQDGRLVADGLPGVAAEVERLHELGRDRIGVDEERFHGGGVPGAA